MHFISLLPILSSMLLYIATGGQSHGITRVQSVVNRHRMLAFSWFSSISSEYGCFKRIASYFHAHLLLNLLILLTSLVVVCSAKLGDHRQIAHTEVGLLAGYLSNTVVSGKLPSFICDAKAAGITHKSARSL